MNRIHRGLHRAVRDIQKQGFASALIGGLAIAVQGRARFTEDIDIAVATHSDEEAESLVMALRDKGYDIRQVIEHEPSGRMATVRLSRDRNLIDLLFASSGIEMEIVAAAETIELTKGAHFSVINRGHLIACKILSVDPIKRPKDVEDLRWLIEKASPIDIGLAKAALDLITLRGFNREKDLDEEFQIYLSRNMSS